MEALHEWLLRRPVHSKRLELQRFEPIESERRHFGKIDGANPNERSDAGCRRRLDRSSEVATASRHDTARGFPATANPGSPGRVVDSRDADRPDQAVPKAALNSELAMITAVIPGDSLAGDRGGMAGT